MNVARIEAISFDLDDTLWPVRPVIERAESAMWQFLDAHYPRVREHFDRAEIIALRRDIVARHPGHAHDLTWLRRRVLAEMAERVGYPPALVDGAFEAFDRRRNEVDFYDDALPALERLSGRFRLVSLSNGNARLSATGLDRWFEAQVTTRDAGAAKPDPRMFRAAEVALGLSSAQVLHVGDDPLLDVQAARRAGQQSVWVNRRRASWPDAAGAAPTEVAELGALAELLGA